MATPSASLRGAPPKSHAARLFDLETYVDALDWTGAITLLRRRIADGEGDKRDSLAWLSYCYFFARDYAKALSAANELVGLSSGGESTSSSSNNDNGDLDLHTQTRLMRALCLFHLGRNADAYNEAKSLDADAVGSIKARLMLHCSQLLGNEEGVQSAHAQLVARPDDEVSLAAAHYARGHYSQAADAYKSILLAHTEDSALNMAVAACYASLEYHDVSAEVAEIYLTSHGDSPLGLNLKAANAFRLGSGSGRAAEGVLRALPEAYIAALTSNSSTADGSDVGASASQQQSALSNPAAHLIGPLPASTCDPLALALLRHNLAVYRASSGGEGGGARIWSSLLTPHPSTGVSIPEARLNLIMHHLRAAWGSVTNATSSAASPDDGSASSSQKSPPPPHPFPLHPGPLQHAMRLLQGLGHEPATPLELSLAGLAHMAVGQVAAAAAQVKAAASGGGPESHSPAAVSAAAEVQSIPGVLPSRDHLRLAQRYLHALGSSQSDCDTIAGRQAMATCLLLLGQFEDANVYLSSIGPYLMARKGEAAAQYLANSALCLAAAGDYAAAVDAFSQLMSALPSAAALSQLSDQLLAWYARCLIMTGRAPAAWELYLKARQEVAAANAATGSSGLNSTLGSSGMLHLNNNAPAPNFGLTSAAASATAAAAAAGVDRDREKATQVLLLRVIANDCYKTGAFLHSYKAFEALHRQALNASDEVAKAAASAAAGAAGTGLLGSLSSGLSPAGVAAAQTLILIAGGADAVTGGSGAGAIVDPLLPSSSTGTSSGLHFDPLDLASRQAVVRELWDGMRGAVSGLVGQVMSARSSHASSTPYTVSLEPVKDILGSLRTLQITAQGAAAGARGTTRDTGSHSHSSSSSSSYLPQLEFLVRALGRWASGGASGSSSSGGGR